MKIFSIFRLRPILRDLARIAAAMEENNRLLRLHWGIREKRPARPIEFGAFDVEAANKDWREKQAEAGLADLEEEG